MMSPRFSLTLFVLTTRAQIREGSCRVSCPTRWSARQRRRCRPHINVVGFGSGTATCTRQRLLGSRRFEPVFLAHGRPAAWTANALCSSYAAGSWPSWIPGVAAPTSLPGGHSPPTSDQRRAMGRGLTSLGEPNAYRSGRCFFRLPPRCAEALLSCLFCMLEEKAGWLSRLGPLGDGDGGK